jgi:hypothetical protein
MSIGTAEKELKKTPSPFTNGEEITIIGYG